MDWRTRKDNSRIYRSGIQMWGACLFLPNLLLPFCVFALWHCFSVGAHSSHKSEEKRSRIVGPRNFNWSATGGRVLMLKKDNKPRTLLQQSGEVVTNSELQWKKEKTEKQWDSSQLDVAVTFHAFYWAFSDPFFIIPTGLVLNFLRRASNEKSGVKVTRWI